VSLSARQKGLLAVLGALLAVVLWQRLGPLAGSEDSGPAGAAGGAAIDSTVEELRVADLEPRPSEHRAGRDPFSFGQPPRPPGPTPEEIEAARLRAEQEAAARAAAAAAAAAALPPEPPRPQPPQITLKYLGSFGPATRRIAVFSNGEMIYNALQGDVLEGKFIVHRIGFESVDVRFVGFPDSPPQRLSAGG
jgi:hypothetical protein